MSATGLKFIEVHGKVGSIVVNSSPVMEVRLSLRLTPKTSGFFFRKTGDPNQVQLRQDRRGDVLELDLSGDRDNLDEDWVLDVPQSLAARLRMDVGKMRVTGIRGGLEARMDVGDIDVDVPEGNITAENDVGDIRVSTSTTSYSNVDIQTDVGKVRVSMNGHLVDVRRAPGSGDSFRMSGSGRDRIWARTDVGAVELKIR